MAVACHSLRLRNSRLLRRALWLCGCVVSGAARAASAQATPPDPPGQHASDGARAGDGHRAAGEGGGAAGRDGRGQHRGGATGSGHQRVRPDRPIGRDRGAPAGAGARFRLQRRHRRVHVGSLVRRAAGARRRGDQPPDPRPRGGVRRLEHPLARASSAPRGSSMARPACCTGTSRSGGWWRSTPRRTPPGRRARSGSPPSATSAAGRPPATGTSDRAPWCRCRASGNRAGGTTPTTGWATACSAAGAPSGKGRLEGGFYAYGSTWNSPGYVSVEDYNDGNLTAAADTTDGGDAQRYIGDPPLRRTALGPDQRSRPSSGGSSAIPRCS